MSRESTQKHRFKEAKSHGKIKEKAGQSGGKRKSVAIEELRQGGGIAHFRERRVGETQKCVYPEEDF